MEELLMQYIFTILGFPQDMVSDRVSQFTSRFWKAFGHLIGSISLFSVFHPQSNVQTERVNQETENTQSGLEQSKNMEFPAGQKFLITPSITHHIYI